MHVGGIDGISCLQLQVVMTHLLQKHWHEERRKDVWHGWIMAALLRDMANLEGKVTSESVEYSFPFTRCIRQGGMEAPRLWLQMPMGILWNVEEGWKKRMMGLHLETAPGGFRQICSCTSADNDWILSQSKENLEQMMRAVVDEVGRWDTEPKTTSMWWSSTHAEEVQENLVIDTATGQYKLPFVEKFKIFRACVQPRGENARRIGRKKTERKQGLVV